MGRIGGFWLGLFLCGLASLFLVASTMAGVVWAWPNAGSFLSWSAARIRWYLRIIGGPMLCGVLVGLMEWSASRLLYSAIGIGLVAFGLAQSGFIVWARKVAQLRK